MSARWIVGLVVSALAVAAAMGVMAAYGDLEDPAWWALVGLFTGAFVYTGGTFTERTWRCRTSRNR